MTFSIPQVSLHEWAPFAVLLTAALFVLLIDAFGCSGRRKMTAWVSGLGLVVTGWAVWTKMLPQGQFFQGMLFNDHLLAGLGGLLILFSSLATVMLSSTTLDQRKIHPGEYYGLLLFATLGMLFLTVSQELITIFLNIEILSLSLYVLTGIDRKDSRAVEAGFKYFILGSLASAFFVFGAAFLFGATGSTRLDVIADHLARGKFDAYIGKEIINPFWVLIGAGMIIAGLAFKLSLAPFHMWAPDVYTGAPTPVTLLIATGSKVAGFVVLMRVTEALSGWALFRDAIGPMLWGLAAISIVWGNLAALVQKEFKRMLAYSSVAHGGYMMVALAAMAHITDHSQVATVRQALIVYLLAYVLMNIVAFGVVASMGSGAEGEMSGWRGMAQKRGGVALALAVALISLTGIPPTVGFAGKFYVFQLAVEVGLIPLAILAVLMSVVSAFYYLRIIVTMYMEDAPEKFPNELMGSICGGGVFALGLTASLVLLFGVLPMIFFVI